MGERIRWLRESHEMSRRELWENLNEAYPGIDLGLSTIQGWEYGKKPHKKYVSILCSYFNCSVDFLTCETDEFNYVSENYTITPIEDLAYYDKEPVLVTQTRKDGSYIKNYALINTKKGYLVFADKTTLPLNSIPDNVKLYARNLYSHGITQDPLTIDMAKKMDKVYITEKNCTPQSSRYGGYYTYNTITHCFERDDQMIILKEEAYNISYIAYSEPPSLSLDI